MKIHLAVNVDVAETWTDMQLHGMLRDTATGRLLSAIETREYFRRLKAEGMVALPISCPTPNPDGTCPGHPS